MAGLTLALAGIAFADVVDAQESVVRIASKDSFFTPDQVTVGGVLGDAIASSRKGRLTTLPSWNGGELITLFGADVRDQHDKTDWYGEHGGKWLYTTAIAARQSGDENLRALLFKTADFLVATQTDDGYIGAYSPKVRITNEDVSHVRSWDSWNLAYMALGLLEVHRQFPNEKYFNAAKKIGELLIRTFGDGEHDITEYGTRHGVSATIILDPVTELYKVTGDKRYLDLADTIIAKMEANPGARLVSVAANGGDMELVGDGKAYQLLWNLTGLVKLYEVTGDEKYMNALRNAWENVRDYHLTIAGGPWGGIGKHKECFNSKNYWSPYGFIETCSTMSWIQLNKELLRITGEAEYAQEIERSAYNALLGAQYPNGEDWCYHSFSNGSRHLAHFNDCCPSSGALALEEVATMVYGKKEGGIAVNLFTASEGSVMLDKNQVRITQQTEYPFDGAIRITLQPSRRAAFPLFLRIPEWSNAVTVRINGKAFDSSGAKPGSFFRIEQTWKNSDVIEINFPLAVRVVERTESAGIPQGGGDIYQVTWFAVTRGPLVFAANGLIDGKDRERVLDIEGEIETHLSPAENADENQELAYELKGPGHEPLLFVPYYEAGGRKAGTWRLTWLQKALR